ncbi:hypothetical protein DIPPA_19265 [Diplonema papillatum]|nr:hypothetical protein DIPPA_19265 [Diplonema papillatum]
MDDEVRDLEAMIRREQAACQKYQAMSDQLEVPSEQLVPGPSVEASAAAAEPVASLNSADLHHLHRMLAPQPEQPHQLMSTSPHSSLQEPTPDQTARSLPSLPPALSVASNASTPHNRPSLAYPAANPHIDTPPVHPDFPQPHPAQPGRFPQSASQSQHSTPSIHPQAGSQHHPSELSANATSIQPGLFPQSQHSTPSIHPQTGSQPHPSELPPSIQPGLFPQSANQSQHSTPSIHPQTGSQHHPSELSAKAPSIQPGLLPQSASQSQHSTPSIQPHPGTESPMALPPQAAAHPPPLQQRDLAPQSSSLSVPATPTTQPPTPLCAAAGGHAPEPAGAGLHGALSRASSIGNFTRSASSVLGATIPGASLSVILSGADLIKEASVRLELFFWMSRQRLADRESAAFARLCILRGAARERRAASAAGHAAAARAVEDGEQAARSRLLEDCLRDLLAAFGALASAAPAPGIHGAATQNSPSEEHSAPLVTAAPAVPEDLGRPGAQKSPPSEAVHPRHSGPTDAAAPAVPGVPGGSTSSAPTGGPGTECSPKSEGEHSGHLGQTGSAALAAVEAAEGEARAAADAERLRFVSACFEQHLVRHHQRVRTALGCEAGIEGMGLLRTLNELNSARSRAGHPPAASPHAQPEPEAAAAPPTSPRSSCAAEEDKQRRGVAWHEVALRNALAQYHKNNLTGLTRAKRPAGAWSEQNMRTPAKSAGRGEGDSFFEDVTPRAAAAAAPPPPSFFGLPQPPSARLAAYAAHKQQRDHKLSPLPPPAPQAALWGFDARSVSPAGLGGADPYPQRARGGGRARKSRLDEAHDLNDFSGLFSRLGSVSDRLRSHVARTPSPKGGRKLAVPGRCPRQLSPPRSPPRSPPVSVDASWAAKAPYRVVQELYATLQCFPLISVNPAVLPVLRSVVKSGGLTRQQGMSLARVAATASAQLALVDPPAPPVLAQAFCKTRMLLDILLQQL